jgi:carbamoyltransferase
MLGARPITGERLDRQRPDRRTVAVVLGLNGARGSGHDAAAALVIDGRLAVAVEEERLARVKRAYGLPPLRAMREVLSVAGMGIEDVHVVAYPWLPRAMGVDPADMERQIRGWFTHAGLASRQDLPMRFIPHHVAHAWSGIAFVRSGPLWRRIGVLVLDGTGESTSGACYVHESELTQLWTLGQAASLGIYFEAISQYVGVPWGQEGKTMALASYARNLDIAVPAIPDDRTYGSSPPGAYEGESPRLLHEARRWDVIRELAAMHGGTPRFDMAAEVAFAGQRTVGRRIVEYVSELLGDIDVLVLTGGVALNCAINSEVAQLCRKNGVEFVVPPPASDTGVAIGCALAASSETVSIASVADPFLGRDFEPSEVARRLRASGAAVTEASTQDIAGYLGERSMIVGWFEGRSEVGPRALGKRSIIARPDSAEIRDRINLLKRREPWRPLAPSLTLREFERDFAGSTPSPYMLVNAGARADALERLGGVIHVDGTARPQVVESSGPYRDLLVEMGRIAGAEAVTCTSFNESGEPIVYSPADALRSAKAMELDLLAGDGWYVALREHRA